MGSSPIIPSAAEQHAIENHQARPPSPASTDSSSFSRRQSPSPPEEGISTARKPSSSKGDRPPSNLQDHPQSSINAAAALNQARSTAENTPIPLFIRRNESSSSPEGTATNIAKGDPGFASEDGLETSLPSPFPQSLRHSSRSPSRHASRPSSRSSPLSSVSSRAPTSAPSAKHGSPSPPPAPKSSRSLRKESGLEEIEVEEVPMTDVEVEEVPMTDVELEDEDGEDELPLSKGKEKVF